MIDLLMPTRGRPHRLSKCLGSIVATANDVGQLRVILRIDRDDVAMTAVVPGLIEHWASLGLVVLVATGDRGVLSQMWNDCWRLSWAPILMHAGDDIVFETSGWDETVEAKFAEYPDNLLLVYGEDKLQASGNGLATHGFYGRAGADVLGYFCPPYFECDYNDTWLSEVYAAAGRQVYLEGLTIRHEHFGTDKTLMDDTYLYRRPKHNESAQIWNSKVDERVEAAGKLAAFIEKQATAKLASSVKRGIVV